METPSDYETFVNAVFCPIFKSGSRTAIFNLLERSRNPVDPTGELEQKLTFFKDLVICDGSGG